MYCKCQNPLPEEIKRGVIICLSCNEEILVTKDEDDFTEAPDLITDNGGYERDRYETQTEDRSSRYSY